MGFTWAHWTCQQFENILTSLWSVQKDGLFLVVGASGFVKNCDYVVCCLWTNKPPKGGGLRLYRALKVSPSLPQTFMLFTDSNLQGKMLCKNLYF